MLYLLIFFYLALIIIIGWIQTRIAKPTHMTKKQSRNLNIAFVVAIPVLIFLLWFFINVFTLFDWAIAGGFTLIFGICVIYQYAKKKPKLTPEEEALAKDLAMAAQEEKVKIIKCMICGNLYNKYTRSWGSRIVCSDECQKIFVEQQTKETKKNLKSWRKWEVINCICLGILPLIALLIIWLAILNAASS